MNNNNEVTQAFEDRGCKIISYVNKTTPVEYVCRCGTVRKQRYVDFMTRNCRKCKELKFSPEETVPEEEVVDPNGEVWRRTPGGWISSHGRAKNVLGKLCTLCPLKFRYFLNKRHEYAGRLVAIAFKVDGYEKLDGQHHVVLHIDGDLANNRLENIRVGSKSAIDRSGFGYKKSDAKEVDIENVPFKVVPEFPKYKIFSNGEIWNGSRFLVFSRSTGSKYVYLVTTEKTIKVHRLVCYAFHPLPDRPTFADYDDLQVNHIDGNPENNNAGNLEWTTQQQNMLHAYSTGLNKKTRGVRQYDKETNELIHEFKSIALASRETGEKEHCIREYIAGKPASTRQYNWKPIDNNVDSKKFSHIPK
jgi:hypothetical protein